MYVCVHICGYLALKGISATLLGLLGRVPGAVKLIGIAIFVVHLSIAATKNNLTKIMHILVNVDHEKLSHEIFLTRKFHNLRIHVYKYMYSALPGQHQGHRDSVLCWGHSPAGPSCSECSP